jgi:Ion transport protein
MRARCEDGRAAVLVNCDADVHPFHCIARPAKLRASTSGSDQTEAWQHEAASPRSDVNRAVLEGSADSSPCASQEFDLQPYRRADGQTTQTHRPQRATQRPSGKADQQRGRPIGESRSKVAPATVGKDQAAAAAASKLLHSSVHRTVPGCSTNAWLSRACTWCFPPMRPYRELCRNLALRSLNLFHVDTSFRRVCIYIVKSKPFERLSLLLIFANCFFLAMDSNDPDFPQTYTGVVLWLAEDFFLIAFTVEMVLKILGLGLFGAKGAYLRDGWNILDSMVVTMGWISLAPNVANVSAMRTVRALRPLRTITGVEGMRMLVTTLLSSMPMLLDVLILCAFLFLIFGTIGVQTFASYLRYSCGVPANGEIVSTPYGALLTNATAFEQATYDAPPDVFQARVCGDQRITLPAEGAWFASNGAFCKMHAGVCMPMLSQCAMHDLCCAVMLPSQLRPL